jgi:hypothetical protein
VDLLSGGMAALFVSLISVPIWGFSNTFFLLALINVIPLAGSGWK